MQEQKNENASGAATPSLICLEDLYSSCGRNALNVALILLLDAV